VFHLQWRQESPILESRPEAEDAVQELTGPSSLLELDAIGPLVVMPRENECIRLFYAVSRGLRGGVVRHDLVRERYDRGSYLQARRSRKVVRQQIKLSVSQITSKLAHDAPTFDLRRFRRLIHPVPLRPDEHLAGITTARAKCDESTYNLNRLAKFR
jgi:hypothetical protein